MSSIPIANFSCPAQPRHLNTYTDKYQNYNEGLMYDNYFGGVAAMTVEHFKLVIQYFYTDILYHLNMYIVSMAST